MHPPLTPNEALSGILGSISLAAWIFLLVPQLVANYTASSASGISLSFLTIWFLGDITNLSGALLARLLPTAIALAVHFCIADVVLIAQCLYYNARNSRRRQPSTDSAGSRREEEPLLRGSFVSEDAQAASLRRAAKRRRSSLLSAALDEGGQGVWIKNTLTVLLVCVVGTVGWAVAWKSGAWHPLPEEGGDAVGWAGVDASETADTRQRMAQILGYTSAACYLGARIPQIIKNQRERSCAGLSLLFFILSLLGNFTYGAGILAHSLERDYVQRNIPWLLGSLGTMAEDAVIFVQFRVFRRAGKEREGDAAVGP